MLYQNVSRLNNIFVFLASLHSSLKMSRSVDMISLRWSSIFIINRSPASSSIIFSLIAIMIIIISHAIDIFDNINNIAHHRHNYSQVLYHFLTYLFRISLDHIRHFFFTQIKFPFWTILWRVESTLWARYMKGVFFLDFVDSQEQGYIYKVKS